MLQDESEIIFSRRGFLRGVAGITGVVGGKLLPNVPGFLPPQSTTLLETEKFDPWEAKKREEIDKLFEKQEDGSFRQLVSLETFRKNGIIWQEIKEGSAPEALTVLLQQKGIGVALKCTYRTLLNKAVERYNQLTKDPYATIIDPDVNEAEKVISEVAELTGLPPDFIKTIAWRENGLRGTIPQLHGDTYCPTIGAVFINMETDSDIFAQNIKIDGRYRWLARIPGIPKGYVLPITTTKALRYDALLGTLIPMAICLEHLEKVFSERATPTANLRDFLMNWADESVGNSPEEKLAKFVGLAFLLYHHGIYRPVKLDQKGNPIHDQDGNVTMNFNIIANERFTQFDPTKTADLKTHFRDRYHWFFGAYDTFLYYKPWLKQRYRLAGTNEAAGHQFYCQTANFIREHMDKYPNLSERTHEAQEYRDIIEFGMIEYFRKNYEKICDPECNTVNLKQEVNNLILDCNYNLTEIRKKASPPLKSQLEKLDKLLKIGRNVFSTYTAEHFGLFFIPTQEQEKACLFNLINYYYSWDDEVWNNNENFLKILLLKYSGEEIPQTLPEVPEKLTIPESEKQALIDFYNSTCGKEWKYRWNLKLPPCFWDGIHIENGHVTKIFLPNNNLFGTIPPSITQLSKLKEFIVWKNGLEGEIPANISACKQLTDFDVSHNKMTGSLPSDIGNLPDLNSFSLEDNLFSGVIPVSLGQPQLNIFRISRNRFAGKIPPQINPSKIRNFAADPSNL